MDNKANKLFNDIKRINRNINKELYNAPNLKDNSEIIDNIEKDLSQLNNEYTKVTGQNIIEFFTKVEHNKIGSDNKEITSPKINKERIEDMLSQSGLSEIFLSEKDRFLRYDDYLLIDSYIPELAKTLDLYRDSILSPDDVTKQSLNFYYKNASIDSADNESIKKNIKYIDNKYKISKKAKGLIRDSLLYGDQFVAILKVDDEINSMIINEDDSLFESSNRGDDTEYFTLLENSIDTESSEFQYLLEEMNKTDPSEDSAKELKKTIVDTINNNINYCKDPKRIISDIGKNKDKNNSGVVINGSIMKILDPKEVVKLEMDGIEFGYLYIDSSSNSNMNYGNVNSIVNKSNDFFNSRYDSISNGRGGENSSNNPKYTAITNIFAKGIADKIDKKFIEDNKEFKDYIYTLIKNDFITKKKINITYLPPESVHHMKLDSNDVYGVSKYSKSLFFAKLYLANLITAIMQKIARGRDKRIIYVETGLDDDIEGVIQGVVKDVKSKEIKADTLKTISTMMNVVGAFDDYFMPMINGEKPIDIDTVPGMDVDVDNDFLQYLLKSTINGTNVPSNYIDASIEVEFSRTLAMQNSTFVRSIVSYQSDFAPFFTDITRHLYKNEYPGDIVGNDIKGKDVKKNNKKDNVESVKVLVDLEDIIITMPPPISLNINNINDQIGTASTTVDFITSALCSDTSIGENTKNQFKKEICKDLLPTMQWDKYENILNNIIINTSKDSLEELSNSSEDDDYDEDF